MTGETGDAFNSDLKFLKGKYDWSSSGDRPAESSAVQQGTIEKYSWADGSKTVSIYIDVEDDVSEDAISLSHTAESVTLTVLDKRLHIPKLANESLFIMNSKNTVMSKSSTCPEITLA